MFHVMSHIKRLLVAGILIITLCPSFFSAMQDPVSLENQRKFQQDLKAGRFVAAEQRLEQGASVQTNYLKQSPSDYEDSARLSLLAYYARYGTAEQVEFLLEHGADPFHYDNVDHADPEWCGHNAFHSSIHNQSPDEFSKIIPILAEKVGVNCQTKSGLTALRLVLNRHGYHQSFVAELLLKLGADPDGHPSAAYSIFDNMSRQGFSLQEMLYKYGANPRKRKLENTLGPKEIKRLKQAREKRMLARHDCLGLGLAYPYPRGNQLREDQAPYESFYNTMLGKYLDPLPVELVEECSDYSGNTLPGALLDLAVVVDEPVAARQNRRVRGRKAAVGVRVADEGKEG